MSLGLAVVVLPLGADAFSFIQGQTSVRLAGVVINLGEAGTVVQLDYTTNHANGDPEAGIVVTWGGPYAFEDLGGHPTTTSVSDADGLVSIQFLAPTATGDYPLTVSRADIGLTENIKLRVTPGPYVDIGLSPGTANLAARGALAFDGYGLDAWNNHLTRTQLLTDQTCGAGPPVVCTPGDPLWSASCGEITQSGVYEAPASMTGMACTITFAFDGMTKTAIIQAAANVCGCGGGSSGAAPATTSATTSAPAPARASSPPTSSSPAPSSSPAFPGVPALRDSAVRAQDLDGDGRAETLVDASGHVETGPALSTNGFGVVRLVSADGVAVAVWDPSSTVLLPIQTSEPIGAAWTSDKIADAAQVKVRVEKAGGWILVPTGAPATHVTSVTRSDGTVLAPDQYWAVDGKLMILDDPSEEYAVAYDTANPGGDAPLPHAGATLTLGLVMGAFIALPLALGVAWFTTAHARHGTLIAKATRVRADFRRPRKF